MVKGHNVFFTPDGRTTVSEAWGPMGIIAGGQGVILVPVTWLVDCQLFLSEVQSTKHYMEE